MMSGRRGEARRSSDAGKRNLLPTAIEKSRGNLAAETTPVRVTPTIQSACACVIAGLRAAGQSLMTIRDATNGPVNSPLGCQ